MICPDIFHWNTGTLCLVYSWSNRPNVRSGLFRSGSLIRSILDYCRTGCTRLSFNDVTLIISVLQFQNKRKFTWNWTIYSRKIWLLHNVWRRCQRWRASISLLVARKPEWLRFRIFQTEACTGRRTIKLQAANKSFQIIVNNDVNIRIFYVPPTSKLQRTFGTKNT